MKASLGRCAKDSMGRSVLDRGQLERRASLAMLAACLAVGSACSPADGAGDHPATGGKSAGTGGSSASAGGSKPTSTSGAGGSSASQGGATGSAGTAKSGSAGSPGMGGLDGSGGVKAAGGASSAGAGVGGSAVSGGAGGAGGANGGSASGGKTSTVDSAVENQSADCQVAALAEPSALPNIQKLPDPFKKLNGERMTTKAEWRCRRQEIRKQAEKYILGEKPTPDLVSGSVTSSKISVHVEAKGKSIDFSANIKLPSKGQAPFPAIINVGTNLTLGESRLLDQGVAVIYYNNYDLGKEGTAEQSRGKPNTGKYYDIYGGKDPAGLLMAWAWGASRMLDVLQKEGASVIDAASIGVTGCSRFGKGAFTIGVFDDRIALTIPQEPSTGGDPALRIMDVLSGAERTDYNYNGLNWLSDNFAPFVYSGRSNAVKLPIDTHSLVAMIAPRGLLVLENPHQKQMGAPAGHMATVAGAEVFKALGVEKNVSYHSSVSDMTHCSYKTEYTDLLAKSIAAFLKHEGSPPGEIKVGSGGSVNRADWIDWTTPTLQ